VEGSRQADALVRAGGRMAAVCAARQCLDAKGRRNMMEKPNRARAFGMAIGIVVLVIALLWRRLLR
jgi:hypothetical protein